jgi:hypothetical protein
MKGGWLGLISNAVQFAACIMGIAGGAFVLWVLIITHGNGALENVSNIEITLSCLLSGFVSELGDVPKNTLAKKKFLYHPTSLFSSPKNQEVVWFFTFRSSKYILVLFLCIYYLVHKLAKYE